MGGELMDRGHQVTWVHMSEVRDLLRDRRTGFAAVGIRSHPAGTVGRIVERAARPGGPLGIRRVIRDVADCTDLLCREAPSLLRELGIDAVLADQMEAAGGVLARALQLPFASIACALPINREPRVPLPVMPWAWAADEKGLHLNRHSAGVYDWMMRPHARVIEQHARRLGAGALRTLEDCVSPTVQLSQTVAAFDFPRNDAPPTLHHVGPLRPAHEPAAAWPPEFQPSGRRPFVFASLGTLQGGRLRLLQRIAQACRHEGLDVLVAHCDRLDAAQAQTLRRAGATWVTGFAPQQEAIARADLVITHAGLNTVMDSLRGGKPMLLLPIAFDQPGVAARVVHAGAGLRVMPALASVGALRTALRRLLSEPAFARQAQALGAHVRAAGGTRRAADLVEAAMRTGGPVPAEEAAECLP
nr:glycosyltransferase [Ramlibacter aurantiacus]